MTVVRVRTISRWLAIAMLAGALAPSAAFAAFTLQDPYKAVTFSDATHGYIAGIVGGSDGVLARTDDGGDTWQESSKPEAMFGIASSGGNVTAIADTLNGIYKSDNLGLNWATESPLHVETIGLWDMAYLAGGRRVVVGRIGSPDIEALIMSSVNDAAWTVDFRGPVHVPLPDEDPPTNKSEMAAIDAAPGGTTAWAVGYDATGLANTPPWVGLIYKTSDGGSTPWTKQIAPATTSGLNCVAAVDDQTAFIGQKGYKLLYTKNGGTTWLSWNLPTTIASINGIDAIDANHVVAVGNTLNGQGRIAWTSNATSATPTWSVNTTASPRALLGVHMFSPTSWIVVGDKKTVRRTTDGGKTWTGNAPAAVPVASGIVLSTGSNSSLAYNTDFKISGTLKDGATGVPGETVILQSAAPGGAYTNTNYRATTDASGKFTFTVRAYTRTWYKVRFEAANGYLASNSTTNVYATPKTYVSNPIAASKMSHTKTYTVYGYLKPKHTANTYPVRIYRWRYVSGAWKAYGYVNAKAYNYSTYTKYSAGVKLAYTGKWKLRAYSPADSGHAATWSSGYDYVTVN